MSTTYEQALTGDEIQARKDRRDALWNEWRECQRHIVQFRADGRAEQKNARKLLLEIDCLQGEIKSGTTLVPRQQGLPVTLAPFADEQAQAELTTYAEFEKGHYEGFAKAYPAPKTQPELTGLLSTLFAPSEWSTADIVAQVKKWDPASTAFQSVAHWARTRHARRDAQDRAQRGDPGRPGITIPVALTMPPALAAAMGNGSKKQKREPGPKRARRTKS